MISLVLREHSAWLIAMLAAHLRPDLDSASWITQLRWAEYAINGHTSAASFECCLSYQPNLVRAVQEMFFVCN